MSPVQKRLWALITKISAYKIGWPKKIIIPVKVTSLTTNKGVNAINKN